MCNTTEPSVRRLNELLEAESRKRSEAERACAKAQAALSALRRAVGEPTQTIHGYDPPTAA